MLARVPAEDSEADWFWMKRERVPRREVGEASLAAVPWYLGESVGEGKGGDVREPPAESAAAMRQRIMEPAETLERGMAADQTVPETAMGSDCSGAKPMV